MSTTPKNKLFISIIAILLLANIAMLIFFVLLREPGKQWHRNDKGVSPVSEMLQKKLGFTEQQMKEYEQLKQQHREKMKPLFEDLRTAKEQLYKYLSDTTTNETILNTATDLIGQKQSVIDLRFFNHFKDIRALCTAEQRVGFDSLLPPLLHKMIIPGRRNGPPPHDSLNKRD